MTLLPSESQQPDGRLSLVWTMVYALAAAFAFGFFNDVVVGRWHPELNEGAQVPRPRESVRRPLALFLYVFVGLYFFSALAFLSRGAADEPFAAGRMSVAEAARHDFLLNDRGADLIRTPIRSDALSRYFSTRLMSLMRSCVETVPR